jgi:ABC-type Fe2+-enterobactin transport system substrate-binding protein
MSAPCVLCGGDLSWQHHGRSWQHYAACGYSGGLWPSVQGWIAMLKAEGFTLADVLQIATDSVESEHEHTIVAAAQEQLMRVWNQ